MKKKLSQFWFLVSLLAGWRITQIINYEDIMEPVRDAIGIDPLLDPEIQDTWLAQMISCFDCCSVWVGLVTTLVALIRPVLLLPFAFSAVAMLLEKISDNLARVYEK